MHNSATIINIAERNAALFSRVPVNENESGWGAVFSYQCERLKNADHHTASVIQSLIETGRA